MTTILGISAYYHDSAAALVVDGELVAAAQEERFTRKKHDESFPSGAIDYCLSAWRSVSAVSTPLVALRWRSLRQVPTAQPEHLPSGLRRGRPCSSGDAI
ncbi:MAG: carbamoyltransferase N-terminal domain-containing protein [Polyangiales bacterium]